MDYYYGVRGWMELSWPEADIEGVEESEEAHAEKVDKIRELLCCPLSDEDLDEAEGDTDESVRAGWCFPQSTLGGTEYVMFGADVTEPDIVLEQVRQLLAIDAFADGFFSIEGEDGDSAWQWLIVSGKLYQRDTLFPDFESEGVPGGYRAI